MDLFLQARINLDKRAARIAGIDATHFQYFMHDGNCRTLFGDRTDAQYETLGFHGGWSVPGQIGRIHLFKNLRKDVAHPANGALGIGIKRSHENGFGSDNQIEIGVITQCILIQEEVDKIKGTVLATPQTVVGQPFQQSRRNRVLGIVYIVINVDRKIDLVDGIDPDYIPL